MSKASQTLANVGGALYGPSWQTPLSEALGVSDRTVRRWVAGNPIPDGAWDDIARLCKRRGNDLIGWSDHIQKR